MFSYIDPTVRERLIAQGKLIRMRIDGIPIIGRNTQGVRLMDTAEDEHVVSVARLAEDEDETPDEAAALPADA